MTEPDLPEQLRQLHFLRDASDGLVARLASIAQIVEHASGATIFRQGEPADEFFLIVSGNVALEICAPGVGCKRLLTIGAGDLLGWSPMLEQGRMTATARAITPTRMVKLSGPQVLTICEQDPRVGYEFMKRAALALAKRLSATRLQLLDVFGSQLAPAASERESQEGA